MAITYAVTERQGPFAVGDNSKLATGKMTLTGTYETNGFAVTPQSFGLSHIHSLILNSNVGSPCFNSTAKKVVLYWTGAVVSTALAEVTNGTTLTAGEVNYQVVGW